MMDSADREAAKTAYAIIRGGSRATNAPLPHWDELIPTLQEAMQFIAAHVTLNERNQCAAIAAKMHGSTGTQIATAIRNRT